MNEKNPKDISMFSELGSKGKESSEYVNVAVAVIEQDGKFLVGKRAPDKSYAGKWAFLGGKFEPGETPEQALRREINEELGMEVEIVRTLPVTDADLPDGNMFRLHGFLCRIGQGPPKLFAHEELRWVTPEELRKMDLLNGDKTIFSHLQVNEKEAAR